mgnify:CR=1 FL=1
MCLKSFAPRAELKLEHLIPSFFMQRARDQSCIRDRGDFRRESHTPVDDRRIEGFYSKGVTRVTRVGGWVGGRGGSRNASPKTCIPKIWEFKSSNLISQIFGDSNQVI